MSDLFATKFNYYHHSPSAVQKPTEVDMFQKILRARGDKMFYGSPATVGRAVEDYVSAVAIDGQSHDEALRHATSVLDAHELLPWDSEADKGRLDVHRGDPLEAIAKNALAGIEKALETANKIEGQEKLTKRYGGLALEFLGFSDFFGGGRVAELKVKTSAPTVTKTGTGKRIGSLPSKPDPKHAAQASFYSDVLGCPASLVYANEKEFRIFDETNCDELTPEGIQKNVMELRSRAWSRENLMRCAPNQMTLMQMLAPDWTDWGWKMDPKFVIEAREIWGLKAA
jgi:hypothetical protein